MTSRLNNHQRQNTSGSEKQKTQNEEDFGLKNLRPSDLLSNLILDVRSCHMTDGDPTFDRQTDDF